MKRQRERSKSLRALMMPMVTVMVVAKGDEGGPGYETPPPTTTVGHSRGSCVWVSLI